MGEFSTDIFDRPLKKRRMLRRKERLDKEHESRTGESLLKKYRALQQTLYKKKVLIRGLRERIKGFTEEKRKALREQEIIFNRKLRSKDTLYKKLKTKYDELRSRKGRIRTTKTKTVFKSYDSPTKIRNFEAMCLEARETPTGFLESFEHLTKVLEMLEKHKLETGQVLTLNHYLCLLAIYMLRGEIRGVFTTSVTIPTVTTNMIRKCINELADYGYLHRVNKVRFRSTILGEQLLDSVRNKDMFGKSFVLESIKKMSGFKDEDNNVNEEDLGFEI